MSAGHLLSPFLREELLEASASMNKLGKDVEGHLRGFGKSMKEQARQLKEALGTVKECSQCLAQASSNQLYRNPPPLFFFRFLNSKSPGMHHFDLI